MIEQEIEIQTKDGRPEAVLYRPEGNGPWPGVIQLTDIGGMRPAQYEMARRLAKEGYVVLMPNVFYRTGRPPVFSFPINHSEERTKKRFAELADPLTPEAMESDGSAYVDFLASQDSVSEGPMGVVGYCITGKMAMFTAAARPERIAAAAAFHGGWLYTDKPSSPHLALPRIKAELYIAHAVDDHSMPAEAIQKLDHVLAEWDGRYKSETYEGAAHAWTLADSPAYNQPQAERAFQKLTEFFDKTLRNKQSSSKLRERAS